MGLCHSHATDGPVTLQPPVAQESQSLQSSIAGRCHADALHCIFAFLALADLVPALRSCSQWWAAGCQESPRELRICLKRPELILAMATSPLRRHVADVALRHCNDDVSFTQLRLLGTLPRLTALSANLDGMNVGMWIRLALAEARGDSRERRAKVLRAILPPRLRSLSVRVTFSESPLQALVNALPALIDLSALQLDIQLTHVDLSPLLQLPRLHRLHLRRSPSRHQCAVVKQLAALTALESGLSFWNRAALLEVLRPPHSLQLLRDLDLGSYETVDPPLMTALMSLPALTTLQPAFMASDCWAGLSGFAQLRSLHVGWSGPFTAAELSALEIALRVLPQLTRMCVDLECDAQLDGSPLDLQLPSLRSAELRQLRLPSLEFVRHSPLLTELGLVDCCEISADDVLHCLQLYAPQLRRLTLLGCVHLSANRQLLLRPPSALLPALVEFSFLPL